MDREKLTASVALAAEIAETAPNSYKDAAFRVVLQSLVGVSQNYIAPVTSLTPPNLAEPKVTVVAPRGTDPGSIADMLQQCTDNADRYLVLVNELENQLVPATTDAILGRFKHYRQGTPKNAPRDLGKLIGKGLLEEGDRDGRNLTYRVIRKGNERLTELAELASESAAA